LNFLLFFFFLLFSLLFTFIFPFYFFLFLSSFLLFLLYLIQHQNQSKSINIHHPTSVIFITRRGAGLKKLIRLPSEARLYFFVFLPPPMKQDEGAKKHAPPRPEEEVWGEGKNTLLLLGEGAWTPFGLESLLAFAPSPSARGLQAAQAFPTPPRHFFSFPTRKAKTWKEKK